MGKDKQLHVVVSDSAVGTLQKRSKASGRPIRHFLERLIERGVILESEPDGSFEDRLLSEIALHYDPTVSDSIRSFAEFRGLTPLELVFRHVYYGVKDGSFFE